MYSKCRRFWAMLLTLALLTQLIPANVFATNSDSSFASDEFNTISGNRDPDADNYAGSAHVVFEVEDRREESEKHFRMGDGSFIAVDYGVPVHFSADGGITWEDIDNTLLLSGTNDSAQVQSVNGGGDTSVYSSENGTVSHSFASNLNSGFLFSTQSDNHVIQMSLVNATLMTEGVPFATPIVTDLGETLTEDSTLGQGIVGFIETDVGNVEHDEFADAVQDETVPATSDDVGEDPTKLTEADAAEVEVADSIEIASNGEEMTEPMCDSSEIEIGAEGAFELSEPDDADRYSEEDSGVDDFNQQPVKTGESDNETGMNVATQEKGQYFADSNVKDIFNHGAFAEISYPSSDHKRETGFAGLNAMTAASENGKGSGDDSIPDLAEQVTPTKLRADVAYRDVFDGVDLLYELYSYNVKETILIKNKRESYRFTFYMELGDLSPKLNEDGSIEMTDENDEVIYLIPAPFMADANGAESGEVTYELNEVGLGVWALTVAADPEWINSADRVFPVSVDPTVILYPYSNKYHILTSYVNSSRPTSSSYMNTGYLRSGYYTNTSYDPNCTGYTVGLIYINQLPKVPDNCVVTDAKLGLKQVLYGGLNNANYHKLYATTVSTPSNPKTYLSGMTWNYYLANILPNYAALSGESTPTALDYQKEIDNPGAETRYVVTNAVQRWYDADDTSISRLLVLDDGHSNATNARVTYGGYSYGSAYAPTIYVTYCNTVGIEGVYGYHTQNIGRAGVGYVNDFTLQTTLSVPIMSAPSDTLPFGISLTYNEALSYSHFTSDTTNRYSESSNIHTMNYSNAKVGLGWKASIQQTVKYAFYYLDGAYNQFLVYTDVDGTEHYFIRNNNAGTVYKDEDGLGRTIITYDNVLFTMKDKENNKWEFTYGYLTCYEDNNGNQLFYAYDGVNYASGSTSWKPANDSGTHRVTGVWRKNDGGDLQKVATLTYSGEYLSTIKDAANRTTTLGYENGCLTSITFPDGKTASYTYSSWANASGRNYYRLSQACDNEANYRIDYHYWGNNPLQISYFIESTKSGDDWVTGQRVNCFQGYANYSRFRYFDANNYSGNGKCVTLHYFDSWGRTVNVVTMNPEETAVLGVSTGEYTENQEGSSKNNRLTNAASSGIQSINLLQNADNEHSTDSTNLYIWTKDSAGGSAACRKDSGDTAVKVKPYLGQYLLKLYEDNVTSGEYKVQQQVYLEANKTYVFSGYVNTACTVAFGTNGGAYLSFLQGTTQKAKSRVVNYQTSTAVDGGWERLEVVFTPATSGTYAVAANINNIEKVAVFDNFQLEKAVDLNGPDLSSESGKAGTASTFNLIQAGSFEFPNASTGVGECSNANQWWTYNSAQAYPASARANTGTYGLKFVPSVTSKRRASQVVPIYDSSNKTYILSGWGWTPQTNIKSSKEMEGDNTNECRFFGLIAKVTYTDTNLEPDYHYVSFSDNIDQWQFASGVIVPKQRDKTVETITVSACLDYCANYAYMDDISLIREPVQSYEYDDEGNLWRATNSEGKYSTTLDSSNRMTGYTDISGVSYELHYTGSSRDADWIKYDGITTSFSYDAAGNITQKTTQAPNDGLYTHSEAEYESTKNFVKEITGTANEVSQMNYNTSTGLLTWSKNPKGVVTHNVYNSQNDRISNTYINGVAKLVYDYYSDGQLQQVNRKSFCNGTPIWQAINYAYDDWGNITEIRIWKPESDSDTAVRDYLTLVTRSYSESGNLTMERKASGQYVTFDYDDLDRLVRQVYYTSDDSVEVEYQFIYNSDGNLAKQLAVKNGIVEECYNIEYDSLGRVIRSREENGTTTTQRTEYLYDTANRLKKQNRVVGERKFSETYTYSPTDGTVTSLVVSYTDGNNYTANDRLGFTYDDLNRLTKVLDTENGNHLIYSRNYEYQNLTGNRTTSRVSQYSYRDPNNNDRIIYGNSYTYDPNGNITEIDEVYTVNGVDETRPLAKYEYDVLNQLTGETRYTYSGTSSVASTTTFVEYKIDTAGNIRQVTTSVNGTTTKTVVYGYGYENVDVDGSEYEYEYEYGDASWSDKLTTIKVDGTIKSIAYADVGDPASWFNGTEYTNLTWTQDRRLSSITRGESTYSYEYDMSGLRNLKVADGLRHEYVMQGGKLVRETVTDAESGAFRYILDFTYDEAGNPLTMRRYLNSNQTSYLTYHYVLNYQGDVVKLRYGSNTTVAEYAYDAWGNIIASTGTVAELNPLRYRGYYYDTETGFYYLQSRYYDPVICRFINADNTSFLGAEGAFTSYNLFAYCGNNPVNCFDPFGNSWKYLGLDSLLESIQELMASVSNIVYGREAYKRSFTDPNGANDLWNSRPFTETKPSAEMQIFSDFMYNHDFAADISASVSVPSTPIYVKVGASKVISPSKNIDASYFHAGVGGSTPTLLPVNVSCSVGFVEGVYAPTDYSRHFLDIGGGAMMGIDYCWWPQGANATSFSVGTSYGPYAGYDYYWYLQ